MITLSCKTLKMSILPAVDASLLKGSGISVQRQRLAQRLTRV